MCVVESIVTHGGKSMLDLDFQEMRQNAVMWVAFSNGDPVGMLFTRQGQHFARWFVDLNPDDIVIFRMRTYPEYRGRGIAPALMTHAIWSLCANGTRAFIDCRVYNQPSIRSILKSGFRRIATMKPLRRDDVLPDRDGRPDA
ncbi:MAG: GNAT family N-acetyltransferase [Phycisphaerales bacterium]|nr:GNAT family N-acetyltransferase [Phycisphaerales bacterium]